MAATPKRSEPFDPFKPVRPSAYNNDRFSRPVDSGAFEIKRPENATFGTPRAPKTMFASSPIKQTNAAKNLQKFVDLTNEGGFAPGAFSQNNVGFGSMGIDEYVDTEKANENIQSLLQGAFEDEDEKQESKLKKKSKKNKKRKQKQKENKKKQEASEVDDLATQLGGITVKEPKPSGDEEDDVTEQKHKAVQEPAATSDDDETNDDDPETKIDTSPNETDQEDDNEEDADEEEEEEEDDGTVEGLKAKLLPHQRDGVNWMCDKETGKRKAKGTLPKGGILADDMGLGKTIQAIALLLSNSKPTNARTRKADDSDDDSDSDKEDEEDQRPKLPPGVSKSTLVVAPLALIKQWEAEIKEKVEDTHKMSVCVYHGNSRAKASDNLEDYDVVITTYGTLTSDHGSADKKNKSKSGLFSTYWYRIILDEAHTIKNRNAKATQAACALDAEYRWCLSGTPMQNNLDELQSLIKFLRIKPYNELATWKEQIGKPLANGRGGLAIDRLQVFLKAFMKRRTKDVLKLNDNLKPDEEDRDQKEKSSSKFQITKREVIKVSAEFMPGETNFYKRLEQRTENSLEKMMGGEKMDYTGALVLLLRLRQSCNHPDLVKCDLASDKDVLLQTGAANSQPKPGKKDDLDSMADLFGALSVVAKKCDVCQMELSKEKTASGISRCSECEADLEATLGSSKKDQKKHSNKKDVVDLTKSPSVSRSQATRARRNRRVVVDSDDEDAEGGGETLHSDDSDTDDEGPESPTQNRKSAASPKTRADETDSEDDIYCDDEEQIFPSTKIRHLMKILTCETSDHKFIVFSFFTSMLDKIEPFLQRAGIEFARYDGGMRNDHREASLNKLRNNRATRVLLCSLRAGALGLNLTAASRVVILEPFWNPVSLL